MGIDVLPYGKKLNFLYLKIDTVMELGHLFGPINKNENSLVKNTQFPKHSIRIVNFIIQKGPRFLTNKLHCVTKPAYFYMILSILSSNDYL